MFYAKKYRVGLRFFDKHGLNFNHLHDNNNKNKNNNNNNNNDDDDDDNELKKFYRIFIVYRLCLDNLVLYNNTRISPNRIIYRHIVIIMITIKVFNQISGSQICFHNLKLSFWLHIG